MRSSQYLVDEYSPENGLIYEELITVANGCSLEDFKALKVDPKAQDLLRWLKSNCVELDALMNLPLNFLVLLQTQELLREYCYEILGAFDPEQRQRLFQEFSVDQGV